MPSRKLTEQLFSGGEDTLEQNHLRSFKPDVLISIVELENDVPEGYQIVNLLWDADKEPTPEIIGKWRDAALPALKAGKKVCIFDKDGGELSLDVVSILMSIHEDKPWGDCIQHVRDVCLNQASHKWMRSEKWKDGFTRHWKTAVKPESTRPSGRRGLPLQGPEDAPARTVSPPAPEQPS